MAGNRVYVGLTVALATSLSANALLVGGGVPTALARSQPQCEDTETPLNDTQRACFEGCIDDVVCPPTDTKLGLEGDEQCATAKHGQKFTTRWKRNNTDLAGDALPDTMVLAGETCHPGTWTSGAP